MNDMAKLSAVLFSCSVYSSWALLPQKVSRPPSATRYQRTSISGGEVTNRISQLLSSDRSQNNGNSKSPLSTGPLRTANNKSSSLFGTRTSKRSAPTWLQTIPALLFLLSKTAAQPTPANAALLTAPPALDIGKRRIFNFLQPLAASTLGFMRNLNKQRIKHIVYIALGFMSVLNIVESYKAKQRQKLDATSEWGRYADKPAARGLALSILLMKLVPYVILPSILEKNSDKVKDEDGKYVYDSIEEYQSSKSHRLRTEGGRVFADGLLRLGPLYIKIGQILSCRENLFPDEWIGAMEKLQDRVPAKSGEAAWSLAYAACPGGKSGFHTTFSDFNDVPLAAASLGQVHKAVLRETGETVAIKIQRPRLRDIYDKDLALMKKIATVVDKIGKAGQVGGVEQSWEGIFSDAEPILYREIDYRDEADNAIQFAENFGIGLGGVAIESTATGVDGSTLASAAEWLRTPYTYGHLSSEKFLVMEYVPSIKVNDNANLNKAGVTVEDREYLAEALAHSYLRQFCSNKFFSTDPHPGNLGIETFKDGRPPRMVFYDFGQACSLSDDQADGILDVVESIIDLDAKRSVTAFQKMGVLKDSADLEKVQAKCQQNYDTGKLKVKKRKKRKGSKYLSFSDEANDAELEARIDQSKRALANSTESGTDVKDAEVMAYFTLQSEYAFVARALSQMDGVGKGLDPDFDFISAAAPYIVEVKGTGKYLLDEAMKKLSFVYDPEVGILAREMNIFKSLGFDPTGTTDSARKDWQKKV